MKFFLVLLFTFSVLVVGAQITLVPYDEPGKSGTKSIAFEYVDEETCEKVQKEFDIQENNPYNNLSLKEAGSAKNGSKRFVINQQEREGFCKSLGLPDGYELTSSEVPLIAQSHQWVTVKQNHAAIAYNMFLYGPHGDLSKNGRFTTVKVVDKKGKEIKSLDNLPYDIYSMELSSDGRFLFCAYGEPIEHAEEFPKSGFKIIDLQDNSVFYDKEVYRIKGFFPHDDEMVVVSAGSEGTILFSFDELSQRLYKIENSKVSVQIGHQLFLNAKGDTVSVSNLTLVK
ncbi:MAG: hypothetical protein ABJG41_03515 [Cyclobacteriaceae bacterium]